MFIDKVNIKIKSGDGGDGRVSFYTAKYVPNGGPDGGDGGDGGNVIFEASTDTGSLIDYYYKKTFIAKNGDKGDIQNSFGKRGEDTVLRVPVGTVIRDADTGRIMADFFTKDTKKIIAKGGRGGKGNAYFKSPTRQAPKFAQKGEKTPFRNITLELKTVADVGLAGCPNAGKSTLLSVVSAAKPKIAAYAFTTLSPNLGVVKHHDFSFVMADIPGLIEGASEGAGLGIHFLRHIERTRFILHVVDIAGSEGRDPYDDFCLIREELRKYSPALCELPFAIAANKIDFDEADANLAAFTKKLKNPAVKIFPISAMKRVGVDELLNYLTEELKKLPPPAPFEFEEYVYPAADIESIEVKKLEEGTFEVLGGFIENLLRRINFSDADSFAYFKKLLRDRGINEKLKAVGLKEGDTVIVGDCEFEYIE